MRGGKKTKKTFFSLFGGSEKLENSKKVTLSFLVFCFPCSPQPFTAPELNRAVIELLTTLLSWQERDAADAAAALAGAAAANAFGGQAQQQQQQQQQEQQGLPFGSSSPYYQQQQQQHNL